MFWRDGYMLYQIHEMDDTEVKCGKHKKETANSEHIAVSLVTRPLEIPEKKPILILKKTIYFNSISTMRVIFTTNAII